MSDPRITLDPAQAHNPQSARVTAEVIDLCRQPEGPRDRQLIFGDRVTRFTVDPSAGNSDWAYVQSGKDGYCGYVPTAGLGADSRDAEPIWQVIVRQTHCYAAADFKSPDLGRRSFGSRITVLGESGRFVETPEGYLPKTHVTKDMPAFTDPAAVAALFLGTPYLWGGNSCWGIDCSGLVQAALLACGQPCSGDSDMQAALGTDATGPYQRNDLLFWKGHVALVTDPNTLIHANAYAMATTYEPIADAIARIASQGDGPVTAHRRL